MAGKTYTINKGINRPITFRGLKGQYIWYLFGALLADMILFVILYITKLSPYLCVLIALGLGTMVIAGVYRMSNKYGEHGLMKRRSAKYIPKRIRSFSRKGFKK
jgi:Domain of unknown function (DUF4133)